MKRIVALVAAASLVAAAALVTLAGGAPGALSPGGTQSEATMTDSGPQGLNEPVAVTAPQATASREGGVQGIQVHGHWRIEVRDPDGALVSVREFENALTADGGFVLASFLSRSFSVGHWVVHLGGSGASADLLPGSSPCRGTDGGATFCTVAEAGSGVRDFVRLHCSDCVFETLVIAAGTGTDLGKLSLKGTAVAQADGNIGKVATGNYVCPKGTPPATPCKAGDPGASGVVFTLALQPSPPQAVVAGQQIQVTVTIGFSSP